MVNNDQCTIIIFPESTAFLRGLGPLLLCVCQQVTRLMDRRAAPTSHSLFHSQSTTLTKRKRERPEVSIMSKRHSSRTLICSLAGTIISHHHKSWLVVVKAAPIQSQMKQAVKVNRYHDQDILVFHHQLKLRGIDCYEM